jgi:hypothetical protein
MVFYHVAEPNSYLAITGAGIESVRICKKGFVYPLQKVTKISITPFDFSMSLQAMTSEKLCVQLPPVEMHLLTVSTGNSHFQPSSLLVQQTPKNLSRNMQHC